MNSFFKKRVLITGGAGGIGLALARRFAAEGSEIVLADIDKEALDRACRRLDGSGTGCTAYRLDVTSTDDIAALRDRVLDELGPVDVLINNAGVVYGGPFLDVSIDQHLTTYRVNIEGVVAVTHAFLPQLIANKESHLVTMASATGFVAFPKAATYASSKWAIIGFSESLRRELELLGHRQVHVTTVCPGVVDTSLFQGAQPPLLTKLLSPETLADKVVHAIETNQLMVLEPPMVKIAPILMSLLPRRWTDRISDVLGVTKTMDTWRGQQPSEKARSTPSVSPPTLMRDRATSRA